MVGSDDIKASVWKGRKSAVLVVANFSKEPRTANLVFDEKKLGFDGAKVGWKQPEIVGVQGGAHDLNISAPLTIPGEKGLIIIH